MGWSSWYAFGKTVDQATMEATFLKMVNRSLAAGSGRSLRDAGYEFANLDDGWQACNAGVDGSFHSADGEPLVDGARFPDIAAMASKAHALGLRPGFYLNNYICPEGMPSDPAYVKNMRGNVEFLVKNGFDYVKVDSGSVYNDMQLWHELIRDSGRPMVVENCHQGHIVPNATWCPFDLFRTSGDLHCVGLDVELMATASVLHLSRPGCWAYPDTIDPGSLQQVRSQFSAFAIMSAPLVLSFDILDDSKLLPIFDILTNEEAIEVNQRWAGSPGRLLQKWSPHLASDPLFPWVEACKENDPAQTRWAYDGLTITWLKESSKDPLCLSAANLPGGVLTLEACNRSASMGQAWRFEEGRLWASSTRHLMAVQMPVGTLRLEPCSELEPGQHWKLSAEPGEYKSVQNDLPWMEGGCWDIVACDEKDGAEVGVNFGCKPLPKPGSTNPCDANGAWSFNSNGTITSLMDGKCLQIDPDDGVSVTVGTCTGDVGQTWRVMGTSIQSAAAPSRCIGSGIAAPPPGTDGRCAAVQVTNDAGGAGAWPGIVGPALGLERSEHCQPDTAPLPVQEFALGAEGRLHAGGFCVAARHGSPTPFGPLQLWAKRQPGGAVAAVLLNRALAGSPSAEVLLRLEDLPDLRLGPSGYVRVRDVWARRDLAPVRRGAGFTVSVPGGDSRFLVLTPEASDVHPS